MTPQIDRLLPSVAALLGVSSQRDDLGLGLASDLSDVGCVVVLLIDGLGAQALDEHAELLPTMASSQQLGPIRSTFPSTTATAITSLGTGLVPGHHGIFGSAFELDDGSVLMPLTWADSPNPILTQPEPTMLEVCSAAGLAVHSLAPARFAPSGLTRAALRGGSYVGVETLEDRATALEVVLRGIQRQGVRGLCYVYWPDLDKVGHVHGPASAQWREQLQVCDRLVASLRAVLGEHDALLVTGDHGMVDVPDSRRIDLDSAPSLGRGVRRILGEPRARHVYTEPGAVAGVVRRWAAELGESATVRTREEVIHAGWFGDVDPWHHDRIGDVVAVATRDYALVSDRTDRIVSSLRGQHGARTDAEVKIPLLLLRNHEAILSGHRP